MKKTMLILLAISCFASAAYATYVDVEDGTTLGSTVPTLNVKGSKGVRIEYTADTAQSGQGYILSAYHKSGTQTFASSSGDTKIYKQEVTGAQVNKTAPVGSDTVDFTGWTAM